MTIKTIGVIGGGQMGQEIAQVAASKDYKVILRDIKIEFCENALAKIRGGMERRVARGKDTQENVNKTMGNISITTEMADLAEADCAIEAAPESLPLKRQIFKELGDICRPEAILCTNTSSLSITEITKECKNHGRCAGMHFFFPVTAMKLVEIIRSEFTADTTVEGIKEVAIGMGKVPVECRTDTPGFIVNRCLFAFMLEAVHCYEQGVATIDDIDTAIKLGLNHPLGPFEMMDMSGLDTFPHVCESLESLPVTSWETPESVKELVAKGYFGRKSGEGWRKYNQWA